jgi:pimeloyl-ACP methyl ester carboxylesterase
MTNRILSRGAGVVLAACAALIATAARPAPFVQVGTPPPGFSSAKAEGLHYVRGGQGPAVILVHGFPQNWVAFREIMPRLARRFTVVAVDLPGIGQSAPAAGGYEAANLAAQIHALAQSLKLQRPYVVGHDLGGLVIYAHVRRFPDSVRGAMILDVPMPGVAGWDEAVSDLWHILGDQLAQDGFIAIVPDFLSGKGPNGGGTESLISWIIRTTPAFCARSG